MKAGSDNKRGLWTAEEDRVLIDYISVHGKGKWNRIARETGLKRCGKSCRLRWMNYLSPAVKRGDFSEEENDLIIRLHTLLGNRWSLIAGRVPGRTDNQVKNHWNTHLSKRLGIKKSNNKVNKEVTRVMDSEPLLTLSGEPEKDFCCISSGSNSSELPNTSNAIGEADHKVMMSTPDCSQVNALGDVMTSDDSSNNNNNHNERSSLFSSAEDFFSPISFYDVVEPLDEHSFGFVWEWDIGLYGFSF